MMMMMMNEIGLMVVHGITVSILWDRACGVGL